MQMRAGVITIILTAILVWLLSGLFYMVLAKDMMAAAMAPYASVMNPMDSVPIYVWLLVTLFPATLLMVILTQVSGPIAVRRGVMMGITMSLLTCIPWEITHRLMYQHHDTTFSVVNCGWDALQWAIGGAVMAMVYSKLYRSA